MSILALTLTVGYIGVFSVSVCKKTPPGFNNVKMFASNIYHIALYDKTATEYSNVFH